MIPTYQPGDVREALQERARFDERFLRVLDDLKRGHERPDYRAMARQYLQEGPFVDPPIAAPLSANTATTAVDMWSGNQYTPIFARDPKAGKMYLIEAGGLITTAATGALTIAPGIGTSSPGSSLGSSIAQTVPASSLSGPWFLHFVLTFTIIGAPGANSTCVGEGFFQSGGVAATANSGLDLTFGGTVLATVDASVNNFVTFQKTLSVAGSFTTHWAYIAAMN